MASVQPVRVILRYFPSPKATGLKMKGLRWLVFMKFNRFSSGVKRTRISLRKQTGYRCLFYDVEVLQDRGI